MIVNPCTGGFDYCGLEMLTGVSVFLQGHAFFKSLALPLMPLQTLHRNDGSRKKDRVSWQLEAAILDWVKSVILVTLHQQLRRDKRVRECLSGETPVHREREREHCR